MNRVLCFLNSGASRQCRKRTLAEAERDRLNSLTSGLVEVFLPPDVDGIKIGFFVIAEIAATDDVAHAGDHLARELRSLADRFAEVAVTLEGGAA